MILRSIGGDSEKLLFELEKQFGGDLIYVWGGYNHYQDWALDAYFRAISEKKTIICAETPLIGRDLFDKNNKDTYYRVAIGTVSVQHFKNFNLPNIAKEDRLFAILENTSTTLKNWRKDGEHILYAMQVPADSSLRGLDVFAAAQYDLIKIREISERPIIISLHPDLQKDWGMNNFKENSKHFDRFLKVAEFVGANIQIGGSKKALENCWCVVCHTSGFSFDSITEGVPVITLSEGNFMAPICSHNIHDIESPYIPNNEEKMAWLSRVAYCQWTIEEVSNGLVKQHFFNLI